MTQDIVKIALCGQLRAGKDTVADYLWLTHGFETPLAFGDALKRIAHEAFPWIPQQPKPRELYQFMNVLREFDKDIYVKHLEQSYKIRADQRSARGIVVTDVRQANELAWCRANGFKVVRVTAPLDVRIARAQAAGDVFSFDDLTHPTELDVEGFTVDAELTNDGDTTALYAQIDVLLDGLNTKGRR